MVKNSNQELLHLSYLDELPSYTSQITGNQTDGKSPGALEQSSAEVSHHRRPSNRTFKDINTSANEINELMEYLGTNASYPRGTQESILAKTFFSTEMYNPDFSQTFPLEVCSGNKAQWTLISSTVPSRKQSEFSSRTSKETPISIAIHPPQSRTES